MRFITVFLYSMNSLNIDTFRVFSIIRSRCEAIFSHDVAKEGMVFEMIVYIINI